jgi:DUF971 family protein
MKIGDLVICTNAENGKEKLGIILGVTRYGAYRVLLQDGYDGGIWTHSHIRRLQCT